MRIRIKPPHSTRQAKSAADRLRLPSHSTTDVTQLVVPSIGLNQGPDGGLRATAQALPWLLPRPFSSSPCVRTWRWSLLGGQSTLAIPAYHNPVWAAGRSAAVRTPETRRGKRETGSLSQRLPYATLSQSGAERHALLELLGRVGIDTRPVLCSPGVVRPRPCAARTTLQTGI